MTALRRMHSDRRGMSFLSFLLLLAVIAGIYSAYKFVPVYLEFNRVKRLVKGASAYWLNVEADLGKVREKLDRDFDQALVESVTAEDVEFEKVTKNEVNAYVFYEVEVKHPVGKPTVLEFEFEHTEDRRMKTD